MEQQKNIDREKLVQDIYKLENKKNILTGIIVSRQELFNKIGTGDIKPGDSFETTIKVGKTKEMVASSIDRTKTKINENNNELIPLHEQLSEIVRQETIKKMENDLITIQEYVVKGYISPDILKKHQEELIRLKGGDYPISQGFIKQQLVSDCWWNLYKKTGNDFCLNKAKGICSETPAEVPTEPEIKNEEWPYGLTNYEISALASHFSSITNPEKLSIFNAFLKSTNLKNSDIKEIDRCLEDINNDSKNLFVFGQKEIDESKKNKDYITNSAIEGLRKIRKIINDPIAYNKTEEKDGSMGMLICAIGQYKEPVVFCNRNYEDGIDLFEKLVSAKCETEYSIDDNRENGSVAIVNSPRRVVCSEMNYDSATIEVAAEQEVIKEVILENVSEQPQEDQIDELISENTTSEDFVVGDTEIPKKETRHDPREFNEAIVYAFFEKIKEMSDFEKGINLAQLTKFFPLMKRHLVDPMVDQGYVRPEKNNGKVHGVYTPVTAATIDYLIYCKKNKIDIKSTEKNKLQDKIAEIYKDWKLKN